MDSCEALNRFSFAGQAFALRRSHETMHHGNGIVKRYVFAAVSIEVLYQFEINCR
jgi:hypothetical protein